VLLVTDPYFVANGLADRFAAALNWEGEDITMLYKLAW